MNQNLDIFPFESNVFITVLCKKNANEFRRISRLFGTFQRNITKFRAKRNFVRNSSNFRNAYCFSQNENSKGRANFRTKYRWDAAKFRAKFRDCSSKVRSENSSFEWTIENIVCWFSFANSPETLSPCLRSCYDANACVPMATDVVLVAPGKYSITWELKHLNSHAERIELHAPENRISSQTKSSSGSDFQAAQERRVGSQL